MFEGLKNNGALAEKTPERLEKEKQDRLLIMRPIYNQLEAAAAAKGQEISSNPAYVGFEQSKLDEMSEAARIPAMNEEAKKIVVDQFGPTLEMLNLTDEQMKYAIGLAASDYVGRYTSQKASDNHPENAAEFKV